MAAGTGAVLVVSNPEGIESAESQIRAELPGDHIRTATDVPTAIETLHDIDVDCVVSDFEVPDQNGIEHLGGVKVIEAVSAYDDQVPTVLFTTTSHGDASQVAIDAGADSHVLRCSTDRKLAELAQRVEQLVSKRRAERRAERHVRINEVLRDVNETLVRASTREAIERGVCRQLTKTAMMAHTVFFRADHGIEIRAEESPTDASIAIEDLEPIAEQLGPEGLMYNDPGAMPIPIAGFAREEGYGSLLSFPVVHREERHGIVAVFADSTHTFDESQRTVFCELGRTIGYALSAVETQTQLARRNERLDEFARLISHDLRDPLTVIDGRLELARTQRDPEHFEAIERATERMEALVADMLRQARHAQPDETRPVSLAAVASRAWEQIETGSASMEFTGDRTLRSDPGRLQQLFEHLFHNALEHSDGQLRKADQSAVRAEDAPGGSGERAVTVRVGPLEDGFFVEDDGTGIPGVERNRVFEYGYTTDPDGAGHGLAIVERVVDDHDWSVTVTDAAGGGARFEITGVEMVD